MPTARQKILSTSWNVQFVAFNTDHHDSFGKLKITIIGRLVLRDQSLMFQSGVSR